MLSVVSNLKLQIRIDVGRNTTPDQISPHAGDAELCYRLTATVSVTRVSGETR